MPGVTKEQIQACRLYTSKDGYNRVEVKGKEMFYMEAVVKDMDVVEDRTAMETLFSLSLIHI